MAQPHVADSQRTQLLTRPLQERLDAFDRANLIHKTGQYRRLVTQQTDDDGNFVVDDDGNPVMIDNPNRATEWPTSP